MKGGFDLGIRARIAEKKRIANEEKEKKMKDKSGDFFMDLATYAILASIKHKGKVLNQELVDTFFERFDIDRVVMKRNQQRNGYWYTFNFHPDFGPAESSIGIDDLDAILERQKTLDKPNLTYVKAERSHGRTSLPYREINFTESGKKILQHHIVMVFHKKNFIDDEEKIQIKQKINSGNNETPQEQVEPIKQEVEQVAQEVQQVAQGGKKRKASRRMKKSKKAKKSNKGKKSKVTIKRKHKKTMRKRKRRT